MVLKLKDNASDMRTELGLGTASTLDVGTGANNLVQLDGSGNMPAVDGSAITGVANNLPLFYSELSSSYSVTPASWTKLSNQMTEQVDTGNCFDPSTGRFTPNLAGHYMVSAQGHIDAGSGTLGAIYTTINKNGSSNAWFSSEQNEGSANANEHTATAQGIMYFNGTTDFIEMYVYFAYSGGSSTRPAIPNQNNFWGYRIA